MPLARNEDYWRAVGWRVFKYCALAFAAFGFLAGFAAARNGNVVALGSLSFSGWSAVWAVTALMTAAGCLFGAVWLLIFKALALASRS